MTSTLPRMRLALVLSATTMLTPPALAQTLPTGGQVVSGQATISQSGNAMTINQSSDKMIANWQSFSIGAGNSVTFNQPGASSVALNRVVGQDPSKILGSLSANGQVFLINPNGIAIGKTGSVQTGGFVASTLGISNADFLAGRYNFTGSGGAISNEGSISGKVVALISPSVSNSGTIAGSTALAAGTDVLLDFNGDGLLSVEVKASTVKTLVENKGLIRADGGVAILTAKGASDAMKGVVNNTGVVQAASIGSRNGRILLLGDAKHGEVNAGGTLRARSVETSAAKVNLASDLKVDTLGGRWLIDPSNITIDANYAAALQTALASGDVTVTTSSSDTEPGDISVNSPVIWGSHVLTLRADNNIIVNASLTSTGTTGSDGLILQYAQTTSSGAYTINSAINLAAGSLFQTQNGSSGPITYKVITDVSALQNMNADLSGRYALGADIDASATRNWNSGAGFAPVGNNSSAFSGSFEGLGHVVSGLSINRPSENYVGLFGYANGAIMIGNVSLSNASIIGNNSVGALVGAANSTTINHADANGTIIGNDSVGGLLGYASYSLVTASFATGVVTGSGSHVGGLAGNVDNLSAVSDSYAEGRVSGSSHVGGLIGYLGANSTATYVYSTSDVTGGAYVGGLVGYNDGAVVQSYATGKLSGGSSADTGGLIGYNSASGTLDRSYWDIETTGVSTGCATNLGSCSATGLTTASALLHQSYPGFSFWPAVPWGHWYGIHGYTRPFLRSEYSTIIRNTHQLQLMEMNLRGSFVLANNLDFAVLTDGSRSDMWATSSLAGTGFSPVGSIAYNFYGTFDGGNHTISGLVINRPAAEQVGLFGMTNGSLIENVGLRDVSVKGSFSTGGLIGRSTNGSILRNSYVTGDINGSYYVGGLVGWNDWSTVQDVYALTHVSGDTAIGGLIGVNNFGTVRNAYAIATTSARRAESETVGVPLDGTYSGIFGGSSADVTNPFTFIDAGWDFSGVWGKSRVGENNGNMMLRSFGGTFYDNYVRLSGDTTKTYGDANPSISGIVLDGVGTGNVSLAWGSAVTTRTSAGSYAYAVPNVLNVSSSSGATWLDYGSGTLIVNKAPLTIAANDASRIYDGTRFGGGNGITYSGFVNGEDASVLSGTVVYGGSAQGARNAGHYSIGASGLSAQNYAITWADGTLTINRATISAITGITALNKSFDGTTMATLDTSAAKFVGMIAGDVVTVATSIGNFTDPMVGRNKAVDITGLTLGGADGGNYILGNTTATATADITMRSDVITCSSYGAGGSGICGTMAPNPALDVGRNAAVPLEIVAPVSGADRAAGLITFRTARCQDGGNGGQPCRTQDAAH